MEEIPIYTIGYGTRSLSDFISALKAQNIAFLLDVRTAPYSKHKPEFSKDALNQSLREAGVRYVFMGDDLGGRPNDPALQTNGSIDYDKIGASAGYLKGIGRIQKAFEQQNRVAVMCSEGKPENCHRTHLIGKTLTDLGIPIQHIDENDALQTQATVLLRSTNGQMPLAPVAAPPAEPDFPEEPEFVWDDGGYAAPEYEEDDSAPSPQIALPEFENNPKSVLKNVFGYDEFRPLQADIVDAVLAKKDTMVIMPTGGGKSLCYQLPALLLPGLTVVVSPLIALMQDQVMQMMALGVPATALNSTLDPATYADISDQVRRGEIKLLYVAPETLLTQRLIALLNEVTVSCLTIDEAHCISAWGHDFRPEYRQLALLRIQFPEAVCIALTATATPRVQQDISSQLNLAADGAFVASFDRPNLKIMVEPKNNILGQTLAFVQEHADQSGIIYCSTTRQVDNLASGLAARGLKAKPYHGKMNSAERSRNQLEFIRDDINIIVATVAFGMGIDKPDVRFVLHVDLPKNTEQYYQQIGRAGRDSLPADVKLLFSYGDVHTIQRFVYQGAQDQVEGGLERIQKLVSWAESAECRRIPLLAYFGETYTQAECANCDNCLRDEADLVDITENTQKILSCIYKTGELFGANHIINVLHGSRAKTVLSRNHDSISTYGIGRDVPKTTWNAIFQQLIQQKIIVKDMQYGSLKLTDKAAEVLTQGEKVFGVMPTAAAVAGSRGRGNAPSLPFDGPLFEHLRTLRKRLADSAGVPPYHVFSDQSLQEMATYFPHSAESFLNMHGVGQAKLKQFGDTFITEIKSYCQTNNLEEKQKLSTKKPAKASSEPRLLSARAREVGKAFSEGWAIDSLANNYNVKRGTVITNLIKYAQQHPVDIDELKHEVKVSAEQLDDILSSFKKHGPDRLRPIFDDCNGQVPYDELHLARLIFNLESA